MKSNQNKIRILITAIGGGGHGDQILKALRLAKHDNYEIYGADANQNCPQFSLVKKSFVLPMASSPDYLDKLMSICKEYQIDALFHGCEPELKVFSENRNVIESSGIFLPINPKTVIDNCMDKLQLSKTLESLSIDMPDYCELTSSTDIGQVSRYPVVVKPSVGGGGSANCFIAQTPKQLKALIEYLCIDDNDKVFYMQEYVGKITDEYTVGILSDMDGNYINSIAINRLLDSQLNVRVKMPNMTNNSKLGDTLAISTGVSHGRIGKYPLVTSQCREIAEKLGSQGPLNIQCRLVEGKVQVFEINPRFSGTTSIRAMMGFNEPDALIRKHILGEDVEEDFSYREGMVLRSLEESIVENFE